MAAMTRSGHFRYADGPLTNGAFWDIATFDAPRRDVESAGRFEVRRGNGMMSDAAAT